MLRSRVKKINICVEHLDAEDSTELAGGSQGCYHGARWLRPRGRPAQAAAWLQASYRGRCAAVVAIRTIFDGGRGQGVQRRDKEGDFRQVQHYSETDRRELRSGGGSGVGDFWGE